MNHIITIRLAGIFTTELEKESYKIPCKFITNLHPSDTEQERTINIGLAKENFG